MALPSHFKTLHGDQAHQPFVSYNVIQSDEPPKPAVNAYLDWKELGIHLLGFSVTGVVIGLHAANRMFNFCKNFM